MDGDPGKPSAAAAETIFNAALELSSTERAPYLAAACGDNWKLRQRVEALLRAHEAPEGFLPEEPRAGSADAPVSRTASGVFVTEQPGDRIGRYRLLQEIGHGGCGVVYMAEQEEPVRRKVALKVIKLGMDTRRVVARFEAERQALALMDHPNIARVLDAGATETGRPYFVMELVGGIKITDYCDQNKLSTIGRLDLFIQVCRAIQHAHQKGVIHRDIKPSNVLVSTQDGVPVPKVIDFGIAKATQGRLTDHTLFTAFEQFIGTPAYMSPEQAELGGLDIDTRSDIYSLGVLLYELLTGRTPFDSKELLAAGLEAMRHTIREKEPPKPSTRLTQDLAAADKTGAGGERGVAAPAMGSEDEVRASTRRLLQTKELVKRLRGDLDWIVMKCLEKDRARRYETANGLARDIERHLADEPVVASPPGAVYRLQKLVRRHKLVFAAATVTAVLLILGLGGISWEWRQAKQHAELERNERQRAEQATQRAQAALAQTEAIEVRRAEEYYQAGDRRNMLPYLALVLRQDPNNHIAAERLISTLSHRNWARLACPPLMHSNRVTSAMFSRDGRWVVTSAADNTAWVWDADTGQRASGPFTHADEINTAEFSPDGQFVVTASDDHTARVWDARTAQPLTEAIRHAARVEWARFSPSGETFVTLCDDRTAQIWTARTGKRVLPPFRHGDGPPSWRFLPCAVFSPNGALLATAARDNLVRVWDCRSGEKVHELAHQKDVLSVSFSPDGRRLATCSYDQTARVWDLQSDPPVSISLSHRAVVRGIEFSPDGGRVVTASGDKTAQVWDVLSGKPIGPALAHDHEVRAVAFSPEGLRVVSASWDKTVRVWDAETGEPLTEPLPTEDRAYEIQFHPDGQRILAASNGKAVLICWVGGCQSLAVQAPEPVTNAEFGPDGRKIFIGTVLQTGVWDALTGQPLFGPVRQEPALSSVGLSPDGRCFIAAVCDGTARLWDFPTVQPSTPPMRHDGIVFPTCFSPDSRRVLTVVQYGNARVWDAKSGEPVTSPFGGGDGITIAGFSQDGRWIATAGTNFVIRVWDSVKAEPAGAPMRHAARVMDVRFSPDSKRLLTASADKTVRLWSVPSGESLVAPIQLPKPLWSARFSPDGTRFLTVMAEGLPLRLWDSATAKPVTERFGDDGCSLAEFSPDGLRIIAGSALSLARLWDAQTGQRLSEPLQHPPQVTDARFSRDGKLLATVSRDGPARIWEVAPPPLPVAPWLPELAEALAGQRFNPQGLLEPVSPEELWRLQERLAQMVTGTMNQAPGTIQREPSSHFAVGDKRPGPGRNLVSPAGEGQGFYDRWARWFLADPNRRTVLPSSPLTLPQYAQSLAWPRASSATAKETLFLQPTNPIAIGTFALTTTNASQADWLSRRALEQSPGLLSALWFREAALRINGRYAEALAVLEHNPSWAADTVISFDKGTILAKLGRFEEAIAAYSQIVSLGSADKELRFRSRVERWRALKRLNRPTEAQPDFLEGKHIPTRATRVPGSRFDPVDLRPHLNQGLDDLWIKRASGATNAVAPLLMLGGVEFEMCGCIRLPDEDAPQPAPLRAVGIQIGQQCSALHFLQGCAVSTNLADGTLVGAYVIHYAGGAQEEIPIVYGQDVRDLGDTQGGLGPATEGWSGICDVGEYFRVSMHSWQNPRPEAMIEAIDFAAMRSDAQPILFAITLGQ